MTEHDLPAFRERMASLLDRTGDCAPCEGCYQRVYWMRHKSGRIVAYNVTGERHAPICVNPEPLRQASLICQERQR